MDVGLQTGPHTQRTGHITLVASRFNKQGNLLTRLALGSHKTGISPHLPTRILKVYVEALTGFRDT